VVAAGSVPAASALASARWPGRSPAAAILLWQALGLGWGLAAVGALAGLGAGPEPADIGHVGVVRAALAVAARVLRGRAFEPGAADPLSDLRLVSVAAGLVLFALLCWVLVAAFAAVLRTRRRHRDLLTLLAHGDPKVPGALVVDHPAAAAYCVPGLRSRIVISAGTLELLDQAELAAVLAHERAHLRERHDLVLLPFNALLRAFRWSAVARRAESAVALLVEMLADDHALRHRPARELATALIRVGAAGSRVPSGALAIADGGAGAGAAGGAGARARADAASVVDAGAAGAGASAAGGAGAGASAAGGAGAGAAGGGAVAVRVARLLRPAPGLSAAALALVCGTAGLLVAVPAALLFISF
jgi:Zn-dependent protease with chaperone function